MKRRLQIALFMATLLFSVSGNADNGGKQEAPRGLVGQRISPTKGGRGQVGAASLNGPGCPISTCGQCPICPTGPTGPTGATGATGAFTTSYLNAYSESSQTFVPNTDVPVAFDTVGTASNISVVSDISIEVVNSGTYVLLWNLTFSNSLTPDPLVQILILNGSSDQPPAVMEQLSVPQNDLFPVSGSVLLYVDASNPPVQIQVSTSEHDTTVTNATVNMFQIA